MSGQWVVGHDPRKVELDARRIDPDEGVDPVWVNGVDADVLGSELDGERPA